MYTSPGRPVKTGVKEKYSCYILIKMFIVYIISYIWDINNDIKLNK
jgi:hypothetical protein